MTDQIVTKSAVSVTEMSRMVGLSRARFYQLVKKGTFPVADQDVSTGRPCYLEEKQRQILDARRRNCGVDGRPILFYSRRGDRGKGRLSVAQPTKAAAAQKLDFLIEGLSALNVKLPLRELEAVVRSLFPQGLDRLPPGEVVRDVFRSIQRQNSAEKQDR